MLKRLLILALFAFAPAPVLAGPLDGCASVPAIGAPEMVTQAQVAPVCHTGYAALVDVQARVPRFVAYVLTAPRTLGCLARKNDFHVDEQLPANAQARPTDYAGTGEDKGHMAPAEDFAADPDQMHDSFSMANMAPQIPGLNRQGWERLEETVRAWALDRGALAVFVGPILSPDDPVIGPGQVAVPSAFWKVIIDPARGETLAFIMPQQSIRKGDLEPWQVSVADVEAAAGVILPAPPGTDRAARPRLWPADLRGYRAARSETCRAR